MSLTVKCPCGKILDIDETAHGKPAQCPSCGNTFVAGEPIRSTTAIRDGEPEVKACSPNFGPEPNVEVERSIKRIPASFHKGCIGLLIVLLAISGSIWWLGFHLTGNPDSAESRKSAASLRARMLNRTCKTYFDKNQRWPEQLNALTVRDENGILFLESREALLDPWGREYQYDANGPKNDGTRPDIWTVTPDGEIIGNWPERR